MARPIEIPIKLPADTKGAVAATQALAKLEAASARVASAQATQAKAQNQVAVSAQRLATEQARTSRELSNAAAAASRAESAAIRLANAQKNAATPTRSLTSALGGLRSALGAVGLAFGAQQILQGGAALAQMGAQAQLVEKRFNALAAAAGQSGTALLQALRSASGGEISDLNLQLAANKANLLGVATSADQLSTLMEIARDRAQQLGITTEFAFDSIVTGLGRGSALILDNIGITVEAAEINEQYAASIGKTVTELTEAEKKHALINAVVAQGKATLMESGGAADTAAASFQRMGAAAENAGAKIGERLANVFRDTAEGAVIVLDGITAGLERQTQAQAQLEDQTGIIAAAASYQEYAAAIMQVGRDAGATYPQVYLLSEAQFAAAHAATVGTSGGKQWVDTTLLAAGAADELTSASEITAESLVEETAKKLQSAKAAQDLADFQADLAAQAAGVAGGHATVGAAALVLAGKWGVAAEEAERLIRLQNQLGGGVGGAGLAGTRGNQRLTYAQQRDAREQRMAGAGPQEAGTVANLYVEQQQAAAQEVLEARKKAEREAELAAKAGGAARVSAEQKAGDKIVDLARDTAAKLVEIDQRAAEQRAAAARQLASDIATTTADLVADQEANDLELVGASEEQRAKLAAREQAEANARIAAAKAVEEARNTAAGGDAQLAQDQYQIRQEQIAAQQRLDEDYYNRRAELGEGDQAALKEQYDQATKAAADAAQVRMDLAAAEAQQRQDQLAAEKQAVLDDAAARAEAMDSTGKSAMSAKELVDKLDEALRSLPTQVSTTVTVNEVRTSGGESSGGGGGSNAKAAGGGSFVTSGPTHFTVGDNPGGRELVSVIPLSGAGRSSIHGPNVSMAGGGVVDVAAEEAERRLRNAPGGPAMPTAGGGSATRSAAQVAARAEEAAKPAIADYAKAVKENVDVLSDVLRLRMALNDPATWTPIPVDMITSVADDADQVGRAFAQIASTYDTKVLEGAKLYTDALQGTYQVIKDGVETFDALRVAELLPTDKLAAFEASSRAVIDTVGRLGAQAATIGDVTALSQVAGAMALLPTLGMGGGTTNTTSMGGVNINIYAQPGQDVNMIADAVMRRLGQSVGSRRY